MPLAVIFTIVVEIYFHSWKYKQSVCFLLLVIWSFVVLSYTIIGRESGEQSMSLRLYASYQYAQIQPELYRENFMNILMFFPGGLLLSELLPFGLSWWKKVLQTIIPLMFLSIGIEFCQYYFGLGLCETDDVFHNTTGALFGCGAVLTASSIGEKIREFIGKRKKWYI